MIDDPRFFFPVGRFIQKIGLAILIMQNRLREDCLLVNNQIRLRCCVTLLIAVAITSLASCNRTEKPTENNGFEATIVGASMAPNIPDARCSVQCHDCKINFLIDQNQVPKDKKLVCPNCSAFNTVDSEALTADPCVARIVPTSSPYKRWDVVAIDGDRGRALLKRIVGLPGEKIEIKDGDIFVDRQRAIKPYAAQRSIAIEVCQPFFPSNDYSRMVSEPADRWQKLRVADGRVNQHYWRLPAEVEGNTSNRLIYTHVRSFRSNSNERIVEPIKDSYAYNQYLSRDLNIVCDIMAQFEQEIGPTLRNWGFAVHDGFCWIELTWNQATKTLSWSYDGDQQTSVENVQLLGKHEMTVSTFDRQLLVRVDQKQILFLPLPKSQNPKQAIPDCIQFSADQGIRINDLTLFRDVYYFSDPSNAKTSWTLGPDSFFVIGDNVPVSIDSRSDKEGPIDRKQLLGKYKK